MTPHEPITNILDGDLPPEGPANPGVPRGYVCEVCPKLMSDIAVVKQCAINTDERVKELRDTQKEIFALMREDAEKRGKQTVDIAVLKSETKRSAAFVGAAVSLGINLLFKLAAKFL